MNAVMNLRVPKNVGNSLTDSSWTLLYVVSQLVVTYLVIFDEGFQPVNEQSSSPYSRKKNTA